MKQFRAKLKKKQNAGQPAQSGSNAKNVKPAPSRQSVIGKQQNNELMTAAMQEDLKSLGDIKSRERRTEIKRTHLVPKYEAFVQSIMAAAQAHPILGQVLVWLFDIGEIHRACELGQYCLEHKIPLPERFKRSMDVYLADEVLGYADNEFRNGRSSEPYFSQQFELVKTGAFDLPDEVTGKYFRLAGLIAQQKNEFEQAVQYLQRALELGEKVKTALNDSRKALKKAEEQN